MGKLVKLILEEKNTQQGLPVTLEIYRDNQDLRKQLAPKESSSVIRGMGQLHKKTKGMLPPLASLPTTYQSWQSEYYKLGYPFRLGVRNPTGHPQDCQAIADQLSTALQDWYKSEQFQVIRETLLQELTRHEEIRLVIEADPAQHRQLPWHLFFAQFLQDYAQAELALSNPEYQRPVRPSKPLTQEVRILAILGNSDGIDVNQDRQLLEQLPRASVTFLVEPQPQEISDRLWEQSWDILFFAGHSRTESNQGRIYINATDSLTLPELRHGLSKAINHGLKLAIFNSCDGLGLASNLQDLQIPQVIVMREPVPDLVAQRFLKYFLQAFSQGQPLYLAVRQARQRLEDLGDQFPYGTWLPVICQNPTEDPMTWPHPQPRQFPIKILLSTLAIIMIVIILSTLFMPKVREQIPTLWPQENAR
jgi:CHAT domain